MVIVNSYALAVVLCFVIMLCWGSWGNTQKATGKNWRYELFYCDYVIGMVLFSLILAFTLGTLGSGRTFCEDIAQADLKSILWIVVGGVIFNASNILLSASTSIAGMSVAFPLGCGLALVLGVVNNLIAGAKETNILLLGLGVALVVVAVVLNGVASGKKGESNISKADQKKGIILALIAGLVMSFFSSFVMRGMGLDQNTEFCAVPGVVGPYTAIVIFALAVLASHFILGPIIMAHPFVGEKVQFSQFFKGDAKTHIVGMCGGAIWCLGTALSYITASAAGPAVSYALGQGAPMVAAIWGIFVWKEFKGAPKSVNKMLTAMFVFFIIGLALIVVSGN